MVAPSEPNVLEPTRPASAPNFIPLVRAWGGVSIVYRKRLQDSPAYRLNHEEIIKSLEEGINFIENMTPVEALADEHGAVAALVFERMREDAETKKWRASGETGAPAGAHGLRRGGDESQHDL